MKGCDTVIYRPLKSATRKNDLSDDLCVGLGVKKQQQMQRCSVRSSCCCVRRSVGKRLGGKACFLVFFAEKKLEAAFVWGVAPKKFLGRGVVGIWSLLIRI